MDKERPIPLSTMDVAHVASSDRAELHQLQARYDQLRQQAIESRVDAFNRAMESPTIMRERFAQAIMKREDLLMHMARKSFTTSEDVKLGELYRLFDKQASPVFFYDVKFLYGFDESYWRTFLEPFLGRSSVDGLSYMGFLSKSVGDADALNSLDHDAVIQSSIEKFKSDFKKFNCRGYVDKFLNGFMQEMVVSPADESGSFDIRQDEQLRVAVRSYAERFVNGSSGYDLDSIAAEIAACMARLEDPPLPTVSLAKFPHVREACRIHALLQYMRGKNANDVFDVLTLGDDRPYDMPNVLFGVWTVEEGGRGIVFQSFRKKRFVHVLEDAIGSKQYRDAIDSIWRLAQMIYDFHTMGRIDLRSSDTTLAKTDFDNLDRYGKEGLAQVYIARYLLTKMKRFLTDAEKLFAVGDIDFSELPELLVSLSATRAGNRTAIEYVVSAIEAVESMDGEVDQLSVDIAALDVPEEA